MVRLEKDGFELSVKWLRSNDGSPINTALAFPAATSPMYMGNGHALASRFTRYTDKDYIDDDELTAGSAR
jgi:hypothetical protein